MSATRARWNEKLVSDVLFGHAQMMPGAGLEDEHLISVAGEQFSDRAFRIVRGWMVLDVLGGEWEEQAVAFAGEAQSVLLAQQTVFDSEGQEVHTRVSSYGTYVGDCLFETADRVYVLAGRGARKYVSVPAVEALRAYGDEL